MDIFGSSIGILKTFDWIDLIDIILVSTIIYNIMKLIKDTRVAQIIKGIFALAILYITARLVNLKTVSFILERIFDFGIVALVVVFQPELRRMLEHIGQTRVSPFRFFIKNRDDEEENKLWMKIIDTICNATESLSATQTGALIVVERKIRLDDIVNTGTIIESKINEQLIENIFFKNAPLHDGGMVIRNGKIYAAGCVLPLSQNTKLSKDLGTRHRAALGISENSDAIVIVVSEETGIISVAQNGYLARKLSTKALKYRLEKIFCTVGTK